MPFLPLFTGLHSALVPAIVLAATGAKKSSGSGSSSFIFILLILAVGAYFLLGPQRKRRRAQADLQRQISPGDQVVTSSGIVGRVETMGDDRVQLTIAPGTTIEVLRGSVARRLDPVVPPSDEVAGAESDNDAPGDESEPGATA